jgi:hypothetical protein
MDSIIKASFWSDARIEEVSAEVKLACLWLITNPARDLCGFTAVSSKRFTFETGLPASTLEGASKGLPSSFVKLTGGVWFARNFLRHQFGKGGRLSLGNKVVIAATRHASKLPVELANAFFEAYPELRELALKYHLEISPIDPPSIPHTVKRDGVRVGEGEGEGEGEGKEGCGEKIDLVSIVHAYPRRQDDAEALEHVAKSIAKGATAGEILAGTRAIAAIIPRLPSGHLNAFVVGAGAFFRREKWRDDPQTWLRLAAGKNGAQVGTLNLGGRKEEPWPEKF